MARQLQMVFPQARLADPPKVALPDGYAIRSFQPQDAAAYLRLMHAARFTSWTAEQLKRTLRTVLPDGLMLAVHEQTGALAATAMATHNPSEIHPYGGELGWVAGDPAHAGKRLGLAVCAAVVGRYAEAGYTRVYLKTDDWRLPAIRTYFRLGFEPLLYAEDMEARWEAVCRTLDRPFRPEAWPRISAPVSALASTGRADLDSESRYPRRVKHLPDRPHRGYSSSGDMDAFADESLYRPSMLGHAEVSPSHVTAGATAGLRVVYTVGEAGLPAGSEVYLVTRGQAPFGDAFGGFEVSGPAGVAANRGKRGFVCERDLAPGESVELAATPFEWTPLAGRREIKVAFRFPGRWAEQRLCEPLAVSVEPGPAERLEVTLPATRRPGTFTQVNITARDRNDNRVDSPLGIFVAIEGKISSENNLRDGRSLVTLESDTRSPLRVAARCREAGLTGMSNPCVETDGLQFYVGDLHCHDFLSEAEGYPDEVYRWAIEDRALDFLSVVPQSHGWHDNETWTLTKYMNERFHTPGRFVPFLGFEWQHSGYGDKVVHYLGGDQPFLPVDDPRYATPAGLYEGLRESDALVIAHHPAYPLDVWVPGTDFGQIDTSIERLVELWSMHGSSEGVDGPVPPLLNLDPEHTVMAALRRGVRIGFTAGSDTHSARPGGSAKEPRGAWGGLVGLWAEDLTRRSLFQALHERRTVALTRDRIVLWMTVNDAPVGSEIPAAKKAGIRVEAWACGTIEKAEILKNAEVLRTFEPGGEHWEMEMEDATGGPAFYHCRITQAGGQLAVCSPVWVG